MLKLYTFLLSILISYYTFYIKSLNNSIKNLFKIQIYLKENKLLLPLK